MCCAGLNCPTSLLYITSIVMGCMASAKGSSVTGFHNMKPTRRLYLSPSSRTSERKRHSISVEEWTPSAWYIHGWLNHKPVASPGLTVHISHVILFLVASPYIVWNQISFVCLFLLLDTYVYHHVFGSYHISFRFPFISFFINPFNYIDNEF